MHRTRTRLLASASLGVPVVTALLCVTLYTSYRREKAPVVVIRKSQADVGVLRPGSSVSQHFEILNVGAAPLLLGDPKVTCACLRPELPSRTVSPGQSIVIEIKLRERSQLGPFREGVSIPTNDPAIPDARFNILGAVWPAVVAIPEQLYLGPVRPGEEVTQSFEILTYESRPFVVSGAEYDEDLFSVTGFSMAAGKSHRGKVAFHPKNLGPGTINSEIVLSVEHTEIDRLRIPVIASVSRAIVAVPSRLLAIIGRPDEVVTRELRIEGPSDRPTPRIMLVTCPSELWTLEGSASEQEPQCTRLTIRLRLPSKPARLSKGAIEVTCRVGGEEENEDTVVTVPFAGIIREATDPDKVAPIIAEQPLRTGSTKTAETRSR